MNTTIKSAADLTIGDRLDFAGIAFTLVSKTPGPFQSVYLEMNSDDHPDSRRLAEMAIDCYMTTKFAVINN
jgi:hypothetical protein